jgi:nicotinate phosphoribosyltransferase
MGLMVDLYELTMACSYFRMGWKQEVTFDLFIRSLPRHRNFLVSAGLESVLSYLPRFRFTPDGIDYLGSLNLFAPGFLHHLRSLRFTGTVWAIPEGEFFLPGEPVVRVTAPIVEAQIVETFLLNAVCYETLIATKAARIVCAARGRGVVDFSPRRDQGAEAAVKAARSSYIAGAIGTSNVLAGRMFGIPVYGTMAHSFVMSFEDEEEAFREFAMDFPRHCVLLVDTYDTVEGVQRAIKIAVELRHRGIELKGIRLDSGNLLVLSQKAREMLDSAGLTDARIMASGDLNEYRIDRLMRAGAPIDLFGVGTELGTSADAPALGGVYKLVEFDGKPRIKLSAGKATLPGRKQVFRVSDPAGRFLRDIIALEGENTNETRRGRPLLKCYIRRGRLVEDYPDLTEIRERCRESLAALPEDVRSLAPAENQRWRLSRGLRALVRRLSSGHRSRPRLIA